MYGDVSHRPSDTSINARCALFWSRPSPIGTYPIMLNAPLFLRDVRLSGYAAEPALATPKPSQGSVQRVGIEIGP